jgi:GMP synthase-like glutamine amidotransferase
MPSRRFAILKAGSAHRETREHSGDFDRMFLNLLAEPGQIWEVHDVEHGQFPSEPGAYDGFVITGSPASAYDDLPWLKRLFSLVQTIHAHDQPLLGVCFGHQVLAQALGGEVRANPQGWDIGVREIRMESSAAQFPGLNAVPTPLSLFELHQDAVLRLPPQAVLLASSSHTACEMFALGATTLGIQGHPEFEADVIRVALAKLKGAGVIDDRVATQGTESLAVEPPRAFLQSWLRGFLQATRRTHAA